MTPASSMGAAIGIGVVRTYQWTLRPLLGCNCRFLPSCSDYAIGAFRAHGAAYGGWLAGKRIFRCNPWHPGGFDPVPSPPIPAPSDDRTGS